MAFAGTLRHNALRMHAWCDGCSFRYRWLVVLACELDFLLLRKLFLYSFHVHWHLSTFSEVSVTSDSEGHSIGRTLSDMSVQLYKLLHTYSWFAVGYKNMKKLQN